MGLAWGGEQGRSVGLAAGAKGLAPSWAGEVVCPKIITDLLQSQDAALSDKRHVQVLYGDPIHTGRPLAARLGYDSKVVDAMPDEAVESFAGVANPFSLRELKLGERVIDLGSGAGFDCFIAGGKVGASGHVVGVDMTEEMLAKSHQTAQSMGLTNVEFRQGILEKLPVDDGWADVAGATACSVGQETHASITLR
jgi:SAM-dependent methyltransferase